MKKLILFFLFTLFFFSFYNTSVIAKTVPGCTTGSAVESAPFAPGTRTGTTVDCPDEAVCFQINSSREAGCYKAAAATAPDPNAPTEPKGCTGSDDKNCTKGSGTPCTEGILAGKQGISTAIGCVPTEPKALVEGLLKYGALAAGGIAFLLMLLASLEMITAEGNAEVLKHAQEKFYSAIIGLLLIIFSVLLMQIIGVDVLGLPGFGPTP